MRVISGYLGGRIFDSPSGSRTHPMSEKMRGAIFNTLGDINAFIILDAYSGSGALAYEAISHNAAHVTLIEKDKKALECINRNVHVLNIENKTEIINKSVLSWQRHNTRKYDLIFCDPPYDQIDIRTIGALSDSLNISGLLVLSYPGKQNSESFAGLELIKTQNYNDSKLLYYRK
ncbi:MAG: 16S rRNA (guanine(966)-N(2))-methyltransferase RsmD [Candidatus Saccharimonadales bacterium]